MGDFFFPFGRFCPDGRFFLSDWENLSGWESRQNLPIRLGESGCPVGPVFFENERQILPCASGDFDHPDNISQFYGTRALCKIPLSFSKTWHHQQCNRELLGFPSKLEQVHLVSILKACYEQLITKLHQKSRDLLKWQLLLTKVGVRILKILSESTSGMKATNLSGTTGTVTDGSGAQYRCDFRARTCPCTKQEYHPFFCSHLLTLCKANGLVSSMQMFVPTAFVHSNWKQAMEASKPWTELNFNFATQTPNNPFLSAEYGPLRGRPRKEPELQVRQRLSRSQTGRKGIDTEYFKNVTPGSPLHG